MEILGVLFFVVAGALVIGLAVWARRNTRPADVEHDAERDEWHQGIR